jgi:hypothetical protein
MRQTMPRAQTYLLPEVSLKEVAIVALGFFLECAG